MNRKGYVCAAVVSLVAAACGNSNNSGTATSASTTSSGTITASVSQATTTSAAKTDLRSLIPTPSNTTRTDGPDSIHDDGIHLHFLVNGAPADVMNGYKSSLESKSWTVTVVTSGGGPGGGGATYTGTNAGAYGVFSGGGGGGTSDVDACAWPVQPANPDCGGHHH
jgi:hypothetical protein